MTAELRVRCCVCCVEWWAEAWPIESCTLCGARQLRVIGETANDIRVELRDKFAMAALTGYIAMHADPLPQLQMATPEDAAESAYLYADAMLAERAKRIDGVAVERNDTERPPAFAEEERSTFSPVVKVLSDANELESAHSMVGATRGGDG